jgi:hypothetical protein
MNHASQNFPFQLVFHSLTYNLPFFALSLIFNLVEPWIAQLLLAELLARDLAALPLGPAADPAALVAAIAPAPDLVLLTEEDLLREDGTCSSSCTILFPLSHLLLCNRFSVLTFQTNPMSYHCTLFWGKPSFGLFLTIFPSLSS